MSRLPSSSSSTSSTIMNQSASVQPPPPPPPNIPVVASPAGSASNPAAAAAASASQQPPPPQVSDPVLVLQSDLSDLQARLMAREQHIHVLEATADASDDVIAEWQAKYDRLFEAHRKLQKTNNSLEDKLLRIVDKFEVDRNQMTRDLASQTQKLVQAKLTMQQLHDQNRELQNDLQLSINLLQNRPSSYLAQRVDTLPHDMQVRVRSYLADRQAERLSREHKKPAEPGKKIRVPIMDEVTNIGDNEKVSAAILAKVLEERSKERRQQNKFCIDVGTQTHNWHFPEKFHQQQQQQQQSQQGSSSSTASNGSSTASTTPSVSSAAAAEPPVPTPPPPPSARLNGGGSSRASNLPSASSSRAPSVSLHSSRAPSTDQAPIMTEKTETAEVIQILRSISMEDPRREAGVNAAKRHSEHYPPHSGGYGNILLASVIRSPPTSMDKSLSFSSTEESDSLVPESSSGSSRRPSSSILMMRRSATCSAMQTDI